MNNQIALLLIVVFAGAAAASFAWPMKYFRGWRWEHVWIGQALTSNVLFPLLTFICYWPVLKAAESTVSWGKEFEIFLFGIAWGLGGVGYGLSLVLLGVSFTYTVLFTATTVVGSLFPFLLAMPDRPSHLLGFGLGLGACVAGTILIGRAAAHQNERGAGRSQRVGHLPMPVSRLSFRLAATIAVVGGVLSASMGAAMAANAGLLGRVIGNNSVNPVVAPLIVLVPLNLGSATVAVTFGLWCASRSGTLSHMYESHPPRNWSLVTIMGLLGFGALLLYGLGTNALGHPPDNVSWACFMAAFILTGNSIGLVNHEWEACSRRVYFKLLVGIGLLLAAIGLLAAG